MILSRDADSADKLLLQRAVERYPHGTYLWLVLARLEAITDKEAAIAKKTYQDENLPLPVRTAAATALSGRDAEAAAFAEKQSRGFLERYGNRYSKDDKLPGQAARDQFMKEYMAFLQESGLPMMLRFLETPAAEALTFEAYQSKNIYIQPWGAAVAACRWPEKFLKSGPGTLKPPDYANLLALILVKEPNLRDDVLKKITEKELEAARARLRLNSRSPGSVMTTDQLIFLFFSKSSAAKGGAKS